jgi:isoleucyl-tRNA synthetase
MSGRLFCGLPTIRIHGAPRPEEATMAEYKKTLNLPVTGFPMKANLVQKEPETLKFWESCNVFQLMQDASGSRGEYRLHDGPPYANGNIHLGHALNKILKDIIIKSRNLMGWKTGYIPGWDCHGLPIEHKVELELGEKKKDLPAHVIR